MQCAVVLFDEIVFFFNFFQVDDRNDQLLNNPFIHKFTSMANSSRLCFMTLIIYRCNFFLQGVQGWGTVPSLPTIMKITQANKVRIAKVEKFR